MDVVGAGGAVAADATNVVVSNAPHAVAAVSHFHRLTIWRAVVSSDAWSRLMLFLILGAGIANLYSKVDRGWVGTDHWLFKIDHVSLK